MHNYINNNTLSCFCLLFQNLLVEEDNEEIENSTWTPQRIGVAKDRFKIPDEIDKYNNEIFEMFGGCDEYFSPL